MYLLGVMRARKNPQKRAFSVSHDHSAWLSELFSHREVLKILFWGHKFILML
jgi:hypothetical protein